MIGGCVRDASLGPVGFRGSKRTDAAAALSLLLAVAWDGSQAPGPRSLGEEKRTEANRSEPTTLTLLVMV